MNIMELATRNELEAEFLARNGPVEYVLFFHTQVGREFRTTIWPTLPWYRNLLNQGIITVPEAIHIRRAIQDRLDEKRTELYSEAEEREAARRPEPTPEPTQHMEYCGRQGRKTGPGTGRCSFKWEKRWYSQRQRRQARAAIKDTMRIVPRRMRLGTMLDEELPACVWDDGRCNSGYLIDRYTGLESHRPKPRKPRNPRLDDIPKAYVIEEVCDGS